jgi:hypothetical protein
MQREELGKSCGGGLRVLWDFSLSLWNFSAEVHLT